MVIILKFVAGSFQMQVCLTVRSQTVRLQTGKYMVFQANHIRGKCNIYD